MRVVIVDYGMGNLQSVANAFRALGCLPTISQNPVDLRSADRIVLPGVGAFGDGMNGLRVKGWVEALDEEVRHKHKRFLGLCLGMQLLGTSSTEHGLHSGLDWIPGTVERIRSTDATIRVPHIGWNDVRIVLKSGLYSGMGDCQTFYFVHSYAFHPNDGAVMSGLCWHGMEFCASIERENIWATQYHPEKSQKAGLKVLRNFLETGCP